MGREHKEKVKRKGKERGRKEEGKGEEVGVGEGGRKEKGNPGHLEQASQQKFSHSSLNLGALKNSSCTDAKCWFNYQTLLSHSNSPQNKHILNLN